MPAEKARILVADDEAAIADLVVRVMECLSHTKSVPFHKVAFSGITP